MVRLGDFSCIETFNPARSIPIENFGLPVFLPGAVLQSIRLISIFQLPSQSTTYGDSVTSISNTFGTAAWYTH